MQVKKELNYMISLVEESLTLSFTAVDTASPAHGEKIRANEEIIDFTNKALTDFLIKLSANIQGESDEITIGSYLHVLNDLERIGDEAVNFYEIGEEMAGKKIEFSDTARNDLQKMHERIVQMFAISIDVFDNRHRETLIRLSALEDEVDEMKRSLNAAHYSRLTEGNCNIEVSPYYISAVARLERVADHLVNVGYSIVNPTGSQK
jgi:phosphate:Na+ symporter